MWNIDFYAPIRFLFVIAAFLMVLAIGALVLWVCGLSPSLESVGVVVIGALVAGYVAGKSLDWACDA